MIFPHELAFRFRPHLLALFLLVGAGIALFAPFPHGPDIGATVAFIPVMIVASYSVMRVFVAVAVRPLAIIFPRIVRAWGLAWFYGAVPLSLLGLFFGLRVLHVASSGLGMVGLLVVVAASMSAGAFESIRVTASRLTNGSSDHGAASSLGQGGSR
jgi:hypothetical protein